MKRIHIKSGLELNCELAGEGGKPVIVFIHGHTGRGERWSAYLDHFKSAYRVLIYDQRGHGDSDKPTGRDEGENRSLYSMERLALDLRELLGILTLDREPVALIGHSMGGRVAFTFNFMFPELVRSIIAISTNLGYPIAARQAMGSIVASYKVDPAPLTKERILAESMRAAYSHRYFKENLSRMEIEAEKKLKTGPVARIYTLEDFSLHQDLTARAANIDIPVLVIHGTRDSVIDVSYGRDIASKVPGCKAFYIEKGSHQITEEHFDVVLHQLTQFLKECG